MSRAKEIRDKRLKEREETAQKEKKHDLKVKAKAKKLFEWVLDMLEHPTADNTADEVYLSNSDCNKIRIGYDYRKGLTDKPFEFEVMEQLAKMFQEEYGYSGEYYGGTFPVGYESVTIRIE